MSYRYEQVESSTRARLAMGLAAAAVSSAAAFYALETGEQNDSGQPNQRDPKAPVERVSGTNHPSQEGGSRPLPYYVSGIGPDGKREFMAHRHVQLPDGTERVDSYRIDGGTSAPAAVGPQPPAEVHDAVTGGTAARPLVLKMNQPK